MKTRPYFLFIFLCTIVLNAQDFTGPWNGILNIQGTSLKIVFDISKSETGYTTTMDSPDQGAMDIPVTTTRIKDSQITLKLDDLGIAYTGTLSDGKIQGVFSQGGQDFPLVLDKNVHEQAPLARPQEPKPPYPYHSEEVSFENEKAGIRLAGTLTMPKETSGFPTVVLISGSGPQNRDEELMGHKPFLVLSDYLTRNGVAVLRYDDRGVGKSTGDFKTATSADFASDVQSAVTYLRGRREIDPNRIGLVGHSEGGLIAPMVAAGSPTVDFMVLMAGSGIRGDKLLLLQEELIERVLGTPEQEIKQMLETNGKLFDAIVNSNDDTGLKSELRGILEVEREIKVPDGMTKEAYVAAQVDQFTSPWVTYFLRYDPRNNLGKVKCPVLAINGSKDLQVPPKENLSAIKNALSEGGNNRVTIIEFPGLNHLFQESDTGSPMEYARIEQTMAPIVLEEITNWILDQKP